LPTRAQGGDDDAWRGGDSKLTRVERLRAQKIKSMSGDGFGGLYGDKDREGGRVLSGIRSGDDGEVWLGGVVGLKAMARLRLYLCYPAFIFGSTRAHCLHRKPQDSIPNPTFTHRSRAHNFFYAVDMFPHRFNSTTSQTSRDGSRGR
jgi:hypothetical protein